MTETVKTLIYGGAALLVALVAYFSRPAPIEVKLDERIGKFLFENFDDPAKAASMEIVKYDAELDKPSTFKVAREKGSGAWTIPSHAGYPADAEQRMRDAALMLIDLKILNIVSQVAGDHALCGVLEPDREKLRVGDEGVGTLVRFDDAKGQQLASLIIGKEVRRANESTEGRRFVRIPGQDVVYDVKIDPSKLSTRFQDWIEQDLLKLSSWDIEDVAIKNYKVERVLNRATLTKEFDFAAAYKDNEWKLFELTRYTSGQPETTAELAADQELNKDKLNSLKTAVDDLKIVDVFRKPKGLGRDLKAGADFMKDVDSQDDLVARGFYPYSTGNDTAELLCANGEVHVGMKEGVEYVLRFGETVANTGDEPTEGKNRYLFVTARVDMDKFPQPETETPPELPAGAKETPEASEAGSENTPKAGDAKPTESSAKTESEGTASDDQPAEEPKTKTAAPPDAEAKPPAEPAAEADGQAKTETTPEAEPEAKPAAEPEEPEAKPAAKADSEADREAREAEILKERERINKENQRKLDEWNEKIKKAKERVAELNVRFGDWYYVVSEEQYAKICLPMDELIKKKESTDDASATTEDATSEKAGDGVDAFRKLQAEGLEP